MSQPMGAMGAMGGPVGGVPQMNVGTPTSSAVGMSTETHIKRLNTAIYDYLLRHQLYSIAKDFMKELPIETKGEQKRSPNQRNDQQPNGIDDGMEVETKDPALLNRPNDLPLPAEYLGEGPFLQDWWVQFWEIWNGQRRNATRAATHEYVGQQRHAQKMRMGAMGPINPNAMQNMRGYMGMNGMPQDLRRGALGNQQQRMTPQQAGQMKNMNAQQAPAMGGNPMERQGSTMENASGSPGQGGDDPPPKRQRLDGNMAQMAQGRPGQPGQMPGNPQSMEGYSAAIHQQMAAYINKANSDMSKGIPPGAMGPNGTQGSPAGMDNTKEMFAAAARIPMQNNGGVPVQGAQSGNHALQDYQMQLMLLEQQNKKRLLMARQEQDTMGGHPAGMGPNPAMIDPNIRNQMMAQMGPNGPLRPPSSHPMAQLTAQQVEMMRQQGGQMMPNGTFPGPQVPQGMMPGQQPPPGAQPAQGQPMGTPRQQNSAMPPPPAPQNATGTQPSSPSSQPAPPTPNQAGKQAKGKKNENKNAKGAAQKKGAAANATPASEAEHPPTPATPMTPLNNAQFNQNKQLPNGQPGAGGPANGQANHQANNNGVQPPAQQQLQPDIGNAPFGDLNIDGFGTMDMQFSSMESGDVLDNFDFDSFLVDGGDTGLAFDANLAFGDGGIETGGLEGAN